MAEGSRAWGKAVARKYIERVNILKAAESLADLTTLGSLHPHPLKGDRKGEYAVTLTRRWRLIFTVDGARANAVRVEKVSDHYGD